MMDSERPKATVTTPEDHSFGEVRIRFPYVAQAYVFMSLCNSILHTMEEMKGPEEEIEKEVKNAESDRSRR